MGAAGNNAESKVHPLCQQQMGGGDQCLRICGMVEHLLAAVIHIDTGIPADMGSGNHFQHLAGADPQAG